MISTNRLKLRQFNKADVDWLKRTIQEPSINAWWGTSDGGAWVNDVLSDKYTKPLIIEAEDKPVGYIQYEEEDDPDYKVASIDILISTAHQGKGYASEAVRSLIEWLFKERGHHRIEIDPAAENTRAIDTYKKIGFKPIGVAHKRERDSSGAWRDSLLMELLKDDSNT